MGAEQLPPPAQRYVDEVRSRIRVLEVGAMARTVGIQGLWVVVILAGAGVPLVEALDGPTWVGPTLGFVVVVAAGIERVFSRATPAAAAQDALRRGLAHEQRMFLARAGAYTAEDAFDRFARRAEELITDYDRSMHSYSSALTQRAE